MRIKSYFAGTVEAALDLARRELGEEAVLLNSRPAPPEARHLGIHEVVFGVDREHDPQNKTGAVEAARPAFTVPSRPQALAENASDWEALRRQIEKLERTIANQLFQATGPAARSPGRSSALVQFLMERDFPAGLAEDLAAKVEEELAHWAGGAPGTVRRPGQDLSGSVPDAAWQSRNQTGVFGWAPGEVAGEFGQRGIVAEILVDTLGLRLDPHVEPWLDEPGRRRVVALCGPPGGGKTTMLAKLAAVFALDRQQNVALLSTDTLRISAADQLRTYAAIMGLPCEILETPRSLDRALAEHAHRQLVLIDTPGWAPAQFLADAGPWADYFRQRPEIEQHLVLPAFAPARLVQATVDRFQDFGVTRLILTHADELTSGGNLIAAVLASRLKLSFVGTGQSIPEDYEAASRVRLLDLAFADEDFFSRSDPAPDPGRRPVRTGAASAGAELSAV